MVDKTHKYTDAIEGVKVEMKFGRIILGLSVVLMKFMVPSRTGPNDAAFSTITPQTTGRF